MAKNRQAPQKAYRNRGFIDSPEARPVRILAEYLEPQARFEKFQIRDTIVFFGSARALEPDAAAANLKRAKAAGKGVKQAEGRVKLSLPDDPVDLR